MNKKVTGDGGRVMTVRSILGIASMIVCAESDATDAEILEHCNRDNPSGTSAGWTQVLRNPDGSMFQEATKAPVQCADHPDRTHFVVNC